MNSVCLAILNYNGRNHLEHLLPTACLAAEKFSDRCAVVVLDNRSTDDDVTWIKNHFPSVQVVTAPKNDFLFSYNWFAHTRNEEILIFLNNDVRLDQNCLVPLVRHFESPDVFSVSARSYDWKGEKITSGPARLKYRNGFYSWQFETHHQQRCYTLFTSGGFMAVDRTKFIELGGFNGLFAPAYCEDVDLCFRAWRRGWRCIYEPESIVWHRHRATWSRYGDASLSSLELRNLLLMQWSTFPMRKGRWSRLRTVVKLLIGSVAAGNRVWATTYPATLLYWLRARPRHRWMKVDDRELGRILSYIEEPC